MPRGDDETEGLKIQRRHQRELLAREIDLDAEIPTEEKLDPPEPDPEEIVEEVSDQESLARLEQERREKEKKLREEQDKIRRETVKKVLYDAGISDFSSGSPGAKALAGRGYVRSDYRAEIVEVSDNFLRAQGDSHVWRVWKTYSNGASNDIIAKGAGSSAESREMVDLVISQAIADKIGEVKEEIEEIHERKRRGADLTGLDTRGIRLDRLDMERVDHLQRTTLPGGYDVVSYQTRKTIYKENGFPKTGRFWEDSLERVSKRRGILIFKDGDLLPIADARRSFSGVQNKFDSSSPDDKDRLGIERLLPGLTHRRALRLAEGMIRDYIISNEGRVEAKRSFPIGL